LGEDLILFGFELEKIKIYQVEAKPTRETVIDAVGAGKRQKWQICW
jgi:hypothetical protein